MLKKLNFEYVKLCVVVVLSLTTLNANSKVEPDPEASAKREEMINQIKESGNPSSEHKILEQAVGDWTFTGKNWDDGKSKSRGWTGTSSIKSILDGRYIEQSALAEPGGSITYEGRGVYGYNKVKKQYESNWIDNMTTSPTTFWGEWDAKRKVLKQKGKHSCLQTGSKNCIVKSEWKFVNNDKMIYTLYGPDLAGKEFRVMELTYTRKK